MVIVVIVLSLKEVRLIVKLDARLGCFETGEEILITLPCEIQSKINADLNYFVIEYQTTMPIRNYDDLFGLNDALERINSESPNMTLQYLEALSSACSADLFDELFMEMVISNDFLLERISTDFLDFDIGIEASAARFLSSKLGVLQGLLESVDLEEQWRLCEDMGFHVYTDWAARESYVIFTDYY